jgi:GntR family transcriptional regulator/MocR family aminotransferase
MIRAPLTEAAVVAAGRSVSVGLYGLAPFYVREKAQPGLMFGYGGISVEQIDTALTALAELMPKLAG